MRTLKIALVTVLFAWLRALVLTVALLLRRGGVHLAQRLGRGPGLERPAVRLAGRNRIGPGLARAAPGLDKAHRQPLRTRPLPG